MEKILLIYFSLFSNLAYLPLAFCSASALPGDTLVAIEHGDRHEKKIALTFDACATRHPSHFDRRITEVLLKTKTPATLFLSGKWMEEEAEHVRYLASLPQFELGNHTYSHPHLTKLSEREIQEELQKTQDVFKKMLGKKPILFRPPYGEYDKRVLKIAKALGLETIEYDLASGDPDVHFTKDILVRYVSSTAREGSIVVMHINQGGWHTAEALPQIIRRLRERGFQLVKVSELSGTLGRVGNAKARNYSLLSK